MVRDYSITDEIKELTEKVMSLGLEVNRFTDKSVFINFHGHVNELNVRVGFDKESNFTHKIFESSFYLEGYGVVNELEEILEVFQNYLDEED
ncbi:hypothetical protein [Jeotgalicoccus psychrophilus]|uniref:hypothetical protein n=1 Tax=Jeotgalicoccus psychrophilus TaxID=157228 RepID=UPI0003FA99F0|nr:hypothetical protein [Jeotgalicoccus psychrophilus]